MLPITLRGIAITTTIIKSSTKVVTATEFSTETKVQSFAVAPTQVLQQIGATQAPAINQQIASLLPALLGNPLFNSPQPSLLQQQQLQQQQALQEALLAQQLKEQQQALLLKQQQEALNEQLLAEINLDDFTDEDLANLDLEAVLDAVAGKKGGLVFPNRNLFDAVSPSTVAPDPGPKSTLVTIFKSGDNPGEFTSLVSTVFLTDERRLKREAVAPSKPVPILFTPVPLIDIVPTQGGPRGPLEVQLLDSANILIESSLRVNEPVVETSSEQYSLTESP